MTPSGSDFALIFSLATAGMLMLAGFIVVFVVFYQKRMVQEKLKRQEIEFDYQQKMMQAELESQESERRRLAADLHDSIGGMLSAIRLGLISVARTLPDPKAMEETKQMLDETITSVRRISRDLLPSTLEKFGLIHALRELCERFQATSSIAIDFHEGEGIPHLDKQRELTVYRIVQELLNNALKHADAGRISVSVEMRESLYVTVEDNGKGFNADQHKNDKSVGKGLGLFNIENRARIIGGDIRFEDALPKGSKITLTLPVTYEKAS